MRFSILNSTPTLPAHSSPSYLIPTPSRAALPTFYPHNPCSWPDVWENLAQRLTSVYGNLWVNCWIVLLLLFSFWKAFWKLRDCVEWRVLFKFDFLMTVVQVNQSDRSLLYSFNQIHLSFVNNFEMTPYYASIEWSVSFQINCLYSSLPLLFAETLDVKL